MPTCATNGIELFYEAFGEGEPFVLIMGVGAQLVHWPLEFCTALAERGFRVIRFDHREVGLSTRLTEAPVPDVRKVVLRGLLGLTVEVPYTLSDMGNDVAGLIDGLGYESAHVFGISMGGMVGQVLATEHPERVRTLTSMMSTTGARRYVGKPRAVRALFMPRATTREEAVANSLRFFTAVAGPRYPINAAEVAESSGLGWDRGYYPRGFLRHFTAIIASGNRTRALRAVRAPTLVIHGTADPLIPLSAGRATARAIQGAELHLIEGLGHHLPRAIWPELLDALEKHAGGYETRRRAPGRADSAGGGPSSSEDRHAD